MLLYWFTLVLAALVVVAPARSQDSCQEYLYAKFDVICSGYYYSLLESALVNNSDNLYRLQRAFFPVSGDSWGVSAFDVELNIRTVDVVGTETCGQDKGAPTFCSIPYLYPDNLSDAKCELPCSGSCSFWKVYTWRRPASRLETIASQVLLTAARFEGLIAVMQHFKVSGLLPRDALEPWPTATLNFRLPRLTCNPDVKSTDDVLTYLISWLKSYAIAQKRPETWIESDRGQVEDYFEYDTYDQYKFISAHVLTLAAFVLINISVMLFMVRVIPQVYSKFVKVAHEAKPLYCTFYWGGSTVLFILVIILFLCDVVGLSLSAKDVSKAGHKYNRTYKVSTHAVGTVTAVKALIFIVEMIVSVLICKNIRKGIHFPFRRLVCVCCCCCICCSDRVKHKAIQAVALWSIMSFVQHLAMSAVPIFILVILSPAKTISILALCLSALFCTIMLVTHVLYMCQVYGSKNGRPTFSAVSVATFLVQILLVLCVLGMVIVIIILYLTIINEGAKFNFGSFFVSLVPSAILSMIGWYVKIKLLQSSSKSAENGGYGDLDFEQGTPTSEELTPLN